ncbi:prepilin-type N-terminal cleavage/methylation domain-containing protein [Acetobacteraceae bacterium]|nr:prepilin-type N-terminal cleavage/methylation domain-containing protein [Candidatus Parcubacteria bacterium]
MKVKPLGGFTLIELLVVIAIIGILTGIIVPNLNGAKQSGRDAKRVSDIKNIQLALALYYNDNGFYPQSIYSAFDPTSGSPAVSPSDGLQGAYMSTVPKDPKDNTSQYTYAVLYNKGVAGTSCALPASCTANGIIPSRYHLGAVMEQAGSSLLAQDDTTGQHPAINGQQYCKCTGSLNDDFGAPTSATVPYGGGITVNTAAPNWKCEGTGAGSVASDEQCYDVVGPQ